MADTRVKISSVVENQLPIFVKEEFPLVSEFLSEYYNSLENPGGILDILQNIDQYLKLEQLTNLVDSTVTTSNVTFSDDTINVSSTLGFPESYGLLMIGSEIITYTSKTNTTFDGCVRGFSGVTSYQDPSKTDHLVFSSSNVEEHLNGSLVSNLSITFLKEFFRKVKNQFAPGFGERELYSNINQNLFIKQSKDFYSTKGTDQSFEILFRALYGEDVEVIKPRDYLFIPSNAQYRVSRDLVVDALEGNPLELNNRTLYQDQDSNFSKAYGSINNVEKIIRDNKEYYVISLDYDYNKDIIVDGSIFGSFSIHPQTKLITTAEIGSTVIDVDSTVGFPKSGSLIADLDNGTSTTITYTSKSYTQFYGCSGIDQNLISGQNLRINSYAYGYSGIGTENVVKVRITGVLSDLEIPPDTKYYTDGNKIQLKTLGKDIEDVRANNWIFNIATTYYIDTLTIVDSSNFSYRITTFDNHNLFVGDIIKLFFTDSIEVNSSVSEILNEKSFIITGQGQLNVSRKDKFQKLIKKSNFLNFPSSSIYSTDVQNTYQDQNGSFYVTSSSLPSYLNESLTVKNKSVTFSGTFIGTDLIVGNHGFYTGDAISYIPVSSTNTLGIQDGIYFVKRVNSTTIKLARSRSNLYNGNYISFNSTVTNNQITLSEFADQSLDNQKLIRNISQPQSIENPENTSSGPIGILVNGVEILNYKSKDKIFYGPLEEINVLSPGSNYDVINPPILSISDPVGTGAIAYCEVEGQFDEIQVVDGGFDYISEPTITITGGNGSGAKAKAQLFEFEHSVIFNAIQSAGQVNLVDNIIGFSSHHKFRDGEKVVYKPDGQQAVGGLTTDSVYYASVQDAFNVKLHKTYSDAIAGIGTLDLSSYGVGSQRILSFNLKKKISSITLYDNGSGYKNRKISVSSTAVDNISDVITAKNHRYSTGDIIQYSTTGTEIGGLSSGQLYYVTSLDDNSFKLSNVGSSTTIGIGSAIVGISTVSDFYFKTNQYVDIISSGSGQHIFNYPPINVTIEGVIGVSTKTDQNFNAILQPIVRGEIKSVFVESGGSDYGSEEIINYNRQPTFLSQSGEGAEVIPIISDGKIVEVLVTNPGSGYNSPPSFVISGAGIGAKLTPIISNGTLSKVNVVYGGQNYESKKTTITVVSSGSGAEFQSIALPWTINLVERNIQSNQITDDDGIIDSGINSNYGLQYTHLYAPRKLRQTVLSKKIVNGQNVYSPDLKFINNREVTSDSHSPIIGWAYDGNPIYGPYGYETIRGGNIKALESGFSISSKENRPSTSVYPLGFFIEDYSYQGTGDLDEHNGRFCITPEFPNGVYAYFSTINGFSIESSGIFKNYRKPTFPYFIGNTFKSKLNEYNISTKSNQDDVDLNTTSFFRNIKPYNLLNSNSEYNFLIEPNKIRKQSSLITNTKSGNVDFIGIKTGGFDYQVKDRVIFDNSNSNGQGVSAEVGAVKGKNVNQISVNTITIDGVEFVPSPSQNNFIAFANSPHNLLNLDTISITGINTISSNLEGSYSIGVRSDAFSVLTGIGTTGVTGIVTYFNVAGKLTYPTIRENDILQIHSEEVKVLNIDTKSSRIRVLREQNGSVGSSHTASTILYERPRKFYFTSNSNSAVFPSNFNRELYFNPIESIGIGTSYGVGIGVTLVFSNPGAGSSSIFIPTRSIYLPNHNLNTGDQLIYSSNGGTAVSVSTDGLSNFQLTNNQIVYTAKIDDNLIGISTYKVGLGSTGSFVGINSSISTNILYFTNIGVGEIHSFTTNYGNTINGQVNKNLVTVSTASTHGLNVGDKVSVDCLSGISTTYTIKYDDYNRRLIVNPKTFMSGDVDTSNDTIQINSHGYFTGQKVIYTSSTPMVGLENEGIYYIIKISNDKFKLAKTYYDSTSNNPKNIDITSTSNGTLSPVNPQIVATKNQEVIFDLSDSSLSYVKNFNSYSAFKFNLYVDSLFDTEFESQIDTNVFYVTRNGRIGIDTNATVTLRLSTDIPENLYYKLIPVDYDKNDQTKLEIIVDSENIVDNNKLVVTDSVYSGDHLVSGITTNTFTYNVVKKPERSSYISSEASLSYVTNSLTSFGEIADINVIFGGRSYKTLPQIIGVNSYLGYGAVLEVSSSNIGNIFSTEIKDIGFEYSSDNTLRPTAQIPQILELTSLSSFERIGISSIGKNYTIAPDLVVIDSITNKVINDVNLTYDLEDNKVTILKNTNGINNAIPTIIPINNSNGIGINSIAFNTNTKEVTVGLAVSYSSILDYPFAVGDKVLVENTSVGVTTTLRGYNSSSYEYALFTLTSVDPNIGGANGTVTYTLENYLQSGENPGTFNPTYSSGKITPQKFFPIFDITLKKNQFLIDEVISTSNSSGIVESYDSLNDRLIVSSADTFKDNDLILGSSSNSYAIINSILSYNASYNVSSSSIVKKGWKVESGFLNNNFQRLHDSDYYQYFSYSLKSKIEYEDWKDAVSSMNHTAGFKKFSDLIVESSELQFSGISTEQNSGDFTGNVDLISVIKLNCINDFDLATEKTLGIDSNIISDKIIFKSATIQDYFESIGNRVLSIDNISNQFNSNPRSSQYSSVDLFDLTSARSKKYITYVADKRFTSERQILLVTLLHNDLYGFLNQYGRVETQNDLGSFDFNISGSEGQLLFYPTKYEFNDYDVNLFSYDIRDTISGIGTLDLGDSVKISSATKTIPVGFSTTTTLVGIASTYRTSKLLVQYVAADNSYYEYDELTVIHDGSNVDLLEYGQISTDVLVSLGSPGIGTYNAYLSGSNINIDFTPNVGLGVTYYTNILQVSIANTSSSGVSTSNLNTGSVESRITSIGSSTSPIANVISEYSNLVYSCAYYIVSLEDTTNNQYQVSEIVVVDDGSTASLTEFGIVQTKSNIGNFDVTISGGKTQLTFTPISNANVQIRVFQNALRIIDTENPTTSIDLTNAAIKSGYGTYRGTFFDVKRSFDLNHKQLPIFQRYFVGSASSVVNTTNNLIKIPNHFFVTGEELVYSYDGVDTTQAIGIATTSIVGVGTTNKLPTNVYAIKIDESNIQLASSAENALKTVPIPITISSVGIGTRHSFTSKKQNSRVLISIDNVIQSPIVSTSVTTTLSNQISIVDNTITVSGITSFFGGDLIKINNEIMKIEVVGFGSTNIFFVKRPWMGTGISSHSNGSLVTKITGDYNIVDNTLNFITAPYGPVPIGTTSGSPDNVDYIGISTFSTFSGRSFIRSGVPNTNEDPYTKNYVFDDISSNFTGYSTSFTLKSNGVNVTGISTDNSIVIINQIFQGPQRISGPVNILGDYTLRENSGITSIQFTGSISSTSYDVNTSNVPLGGMIVSVASTAGLGYQPLVAAGGTAIISGFGTVSAISIGNSGSGYRSGLQTVRVGVQTEDLNDTNITYIGIASISDGRIVSIAITNPGIGYTSTNPPLVIFDSPLSYSNIPLVYSSSSVAGFGSGAKINIVVGQGSSVIDFEITNIGYGYGQGEILTVGLGGTVGIPTDSTIQYKEFQITVDRTYSDSFCGWSLGNLLILDPIDSLFDGVTLSFPISVDGQQKSIRSRSGSNIDVQETLLVFINDILQVPGEGYVFDGGSYINFTEPPKEGDTSKIIFYQGTSSVDVLDVDILETIKVGDKIRLNDDNISYKENERIVNTINSIDSVNTNPYAGPGITANETYVRPVIWCKQTEDLFINGKEITKDRIWHEPLIYPNTRIIQSVGVASTVIFVESVKTFFDNAKENFTKQNKIRIVSQKNVVGASASAVVSIAGTISSVSIVNGGIGYTFAPSIVFANPVGLGITQRASAISSITSGIVTSITVTSPGTAYTSTNPPVVLIENPKVSNYIEDISSVTYEGDFGIISGISTTSVGVASTGIVFDLVIPSNSFLRDSSIVGTAITVSGIKTDYYFVVYNSNIGNGVISLRQDGSVVGIGSTFLDNVYSVSAVSIAQTSVVGFGITYVAKVTVSVANYNNLIGIGYSNFFGEYSWGKISIPIRDNAKDFEFYNNGLIGVSTSPIVERYNPLKYLNYT
jgi:hypothetical protein